MITGNSCTRSVYATVLHVRLLACWWSLFSHHNSEFVIIFCSCNTWIWMIIDTTRCCTFIGAMYGLLLPDKRFLKIDYICVTKCIGEAGGKYISRIFQYAFHRHFILFFHGTRLGEFVHANGGSVSARECAEWPVMKSVLMTNENLLDVGLKIVRYYGIECAVLCSLSHFCSIWTE